MPSHIGSGIIQTPFIQELNSMKNSIEFRISKYIEKIVPISEGNRNRILYRLGLRLRIKFGLIGDALIRVLSKINQDKCVIPLSESEVICIAGNVDKSHKPIGDLLVVPAGQQLTETTTSKQQTVYTVSASGTPIPVADLLQRKVSFYRNKPHKIPTDTVTIVEVLEMIYTGEGITDLIKAIRSEPDKNKRNELKRGLSAVTLHANPQERRNNAACEKAGRSGFLALDFDDIPADKLPVAKEEIAEHPSVFAICESASKTGLVALAAYEGAPDLKALMTALQHDFPDYTIDMSGVDMSRLRYLTFDPDLFIKSGEVSPAILTEQAVPVPPLPATIIPLPLPPLVPCGVDVLDNILSKLPIVNWGLYETVKSNGKVEPPSERDYILRTLEQILPTADREGTPIVNHTSGIYYFIGTHYQLADEQVLKNFLIEASIRSAVPPGCVKILWVF
jgi:hypothetical protein